MAKKSALNPNARKWVKALRSGKYKQTKGTLTRLKDGKPNSHCCLGVACELAVKSGVQLAVSDGVDGYRRYSGRSGSLPVTVMAWLGLRETSGEYDFSSLATLNDCGRRFSTIADVIESQPKGLFKQ